MSLFNDILSKLQDGYSKETQATETIAKIVSETLHTTVTKEQISVHGTTLRIKAAPTLKMVINLKKEKLLASLQEAGIKISTIQ
jgi:hypothetical protein